MIKNFSKAFAVLLLAALVHANAFALEPDEILDDPVLEARARVVAKQLRCVVCQNQSIDDSNADLARDMRLLVRDRILAGDSNQDVLDYMVDRYGDYVLLNPPFKPSTFLLWTGPAIIGGFGLMAVFLYYRRNTGNAAQAKPIQKAVATPLTDAERKKLDKLLGENDGAGKA